MKKQVYAIFAAAVLCLTLAACSAGSGSETVVVSGDGTLENTITVTGRDVVKIQPDMAEIVFIVETDDEDSLKCQQENAGLVDGLLSFLKEKDFPDTSIKTSGYSLNTDYGWVDGDYQFIGYEMTTRITVSDVSVDDAGSVLAGGVAAGATGVRSVSYYSTEYDAAYDEALIKAVDQAKDKAQTLADAGGSTLGKVIRMEEYSDSQYGRYVSSNISIDAVTVYGNGDGDGDDYMPFMAGEMEVSADVEVVFECD